MNETGHDVCSLCGYPLHTGEHGPHPNEPKSAIKSEENAEAGAEIEVVRQVFEYRDSEGKFLGRARLELEPAEIKHDFGMGRRLKSFVLEGDGEAQKIDVLALANLHNTEIIVSSKRANRDLPGEAYSYNLETNKAIVPSLETPLDLGVMLHELGHADQFRQKEYGKMKKAYGETVAGLASDIAERIRMVIEMIPEAEKMVPSENWEQAFDALQRERQKNITESWRLTKTKQKEFGNVQRFEGALAMVDRLVPPAERDARKEEIRPQLEAARSRYESIVARVQEFEKIIEILRHREKEMKKPLIDIMSVPTRMLERDATRRALKWLRKIREHTGIDLLHSKVTVAKKDTFASEKEDCESSVSAGLEDDPNAMMNTTIVDDLSAALKLYGAQKSPLR